MPVVGERPNKQIGTGSRNQSPLYAYAKAFKETADSIINESGYDIFDEPNRVLRGASSKEAMKRFFVENCIDENNATLTAEDREDAIKSMSEQFENDVEGILEHSVLAQYNPIVGMALPVHKLILMNMVFDKGAIQKVTAVAPKFPITLERRILVTPAGEEIDMFTQQNLMTAAIDATAPFKEFELTIPETGKTDILGKLGGVAPLDHIALSSYISGIMIPGVVYEVGDKLPNEDGYVTEESEVATEETVADTWYRVNIKFNPNYGGPGRFERIVSQPVRIPLKKKDASGNVVIENVEDQVAATFDKDRFTINTFGKVTKVKVNTRLDTSNAMLETCSVKWNRDVELVEIDSAIPINTTISPEEIKDLAALYQVNQLTKLMEMFKIALAQYKNDHILMGLNESYATLHPTCKTYGTFDFAPRDGYALDHVEWRHRTFFDYLDSEVTKLLQVLNDPNVTVAIFGDPDLIRKITPKEYTYQAPAAIGPVELDYCQTVVNATDKRVYNLLGSDNLRGSDELIIILNPRNTDRIIYRIYDYQMYVSNEIRNSANPALPAIHAMERFLFKEYQGVQGRVKILNRSGLRG